MDLTTNLGVWSPDQSEITSFVVSNMMKGKDDTNPGFGYDDYVGSAGSVTIKTNHNIKKITLKVISFSSAQLVKFSVNGKEFSKDKESTWNGKLESMFEVTLEFDEATNTLNFSIPCDLYNQFAIVGMTLEF